MDLKLIIAKHAIAKEELLGEDERLVFDEEESSVSDNVPPDVEEFREIVNRKNSEFAPSGLRGSPESPSSPGNISRNYGSIKDKRGQASLFDTVLNGLQGADPGEDLDPDSDEDPDEDLRLAAQDLGFRRPGQKKRSRSKPAKHKLPEATANPASPANLIEIDGDWDLAEEAPESILNVPSTRQPRNSLPVQTSISPNRFTQPVLQCGNHHSKAFTSSNPPERHGRSLTIQQTTSKLSACYESSEFRSVSVSNSRVRDLIRLEKKLTKEFINKEQELISSFVNSQPDLFGQYRSLQEQLDRIRKELNIYVLSTGTQCSLIASPLELRRTSNPSALNTLSDFATSARNPLEEIRDEDEMELLSKVFDNDKVLQSISLKDKLQIVKSLRGHKKEQCRDMCPHLLRVLKIKWRCRGTLYPIRNILIKSLDT